MVIRESYHRGDLVRLFIMGFNRGDINGLGDFKKAWTCEAELGYSMLLIWL